MSFYSFHLGLLFLPGFVGVRQPCQSTGLGISSDILVQLNDYKKFLSEVDAGAISQGDSPEQVPAQLDTRHPYAVAFHLDLGWGEQFVTSIADVIESAMEFENIRGGNDLTQ